MVAHPVAVAASPWNPALPLWASGNGVANVAACEAAAAASQITACWEAVVARTRVLKRYSRLQRTYTAIRFLKGL